MCKNAALMGGNQGANVGLGTVVSCQEAECTNCKSNYQMCATCNTGSSFYLDSITCKNQAVLGANQGINSALGTVVACQTTNCLDCKANYQTCISCDTGSGFYLDSITCKNQAMLTSGQGINIPSQIISPCFSSGCINCKADHLTCLECDGSQGYTLNNTNCLRRCADTRCSNCPNNYQICTECDQANGYILVNGNCELPKNIKLVSETIRQRKYEYSDRSVTVVFQFDIDKESLIDLELNKLAEILDEVEQKSYQCQSATATTGIRCELVPLSNGFQIKFTSDVSIVKGKVIIQDPAQQNNPKGYIRAASSKVLFKDYQIVIDGLSFAENKALESAAAPLTAVTSYSSILTIGMSGVSFHVA